MTEQAVLQPGIWRAMLTLIVASVAIMGSPGPSTMSAAAMGAGYGFRGSLRYLCGLVAGTMLVLFAVAIGVETILLSIPHAAPMLFAVASIYMLYLAFKIAVAQLPAHRHDQAPAPGFAGGVVLAIGNPKAYLAIAAVFSGTGAVREGQAPGAAVKVALLAVMIVIIHIFWLSAGASLSRVMQDAIGFRLISVLLAASLVVTIAIMMLS